MANYLQLNVARRILGDVIIGGLDDVDTFKIILNQYDPKVNTVAVNISFDVEKASIAYNYAVPTVLNVDQEELEISTDKLSNLKFKLTPTFENNDHTLRITLSWDKISQ